MTSNEQVSPSSISSRAATEPASSLNSPAVTRIPYEIFKEIIIHTCVYTPKPQEKDEYALDIQLVFPPIVASHVCRWWRHTLLSDPHMWTCLPIPKIKPRGITELLRRSDSDSNLLYIFLSLGHYPELNDDNTATMLSVLFKQIHRAKLLHLHVNAVDSPSGFSCDFFRMWIQHVLSYLEQPAPKLETFRFWYTDPEYPLNPNFLHKLFVGQVPNLKHLHIPFIHNSKQLPRPLFHDLSELHLTILPDTEVLYEYLLDLLQVLPRLKLFRLFSDWDSRNNVRTSIYDLPPDRRIHLPHLERFVLEVNRVVNLANAFLHYVTFPKNTKWRIISEDKDESMVSPEYQKLFRAVRSSLTFLHIHFTIVGKVVLSLKGSEECGRQDRLNQSDDHELVYIFAHAGKLIQWGPRPLTAHIIVSACPITHLYLEFESDAGRTLYPQLFALIPNVVSITIKQKTEIDSFELWGSFITEPWLFCLLALQLKDSDSDDSPISGSIGGPGDPQVVFPCLSLREITIDLGFPLEKDHMSQIRKCYDKRLKNGLPFQIFVRCPRMEEGLESMLKMGGYDMVHVFCSG